MERYGGLTAAVNCFALHMTDCHSLLLQSEQERETAHRGGLHLYRWIDGKGTHESSALLSLNANQLSLFNAQPDTQGPRPKSLLSCCESASLKQHHYISGSRLHCHQPTQYSSCAFYKQGCPGKNIIFLQNLNHHFL